ncbi:MAG: sulfurtransferase [Gammaproteobacteria bacterium]|nr:sulfurtransferase [Gammaproteobacteria bacterium]MBU0788457.1 sulfurtransferase [Gammaproteobacteria bacterium]MBU0816436.1 sulfurtransferase [Gammaproteobacteria bacterium]MBU1788073.1 sulfurtransferase [Gammaproteobacteria bacterium]
MYTTLITAEQLKALQMSGQPYLVFDCSYDLMKPEDGAAMYLQGHIAGAVRADLNQHLSAHGGGATASGGRHPLPTREDFAAWLASVGFSSDMQAVVYDRQSANYCGRLWWMLKWVGVEAAAVLDGGLQAWEAAQGDVATGPQAPRVASNFKPAAAKATLVTSQDVMARLGRPSQTVIDARAAARFRGEVEPLDPVAGHIPGALNRPFGDNIGVDGKFKAAEQLKAEFLELLGSRDPASVVHQCGSGVSAVPNLLAMEIAGLGHAALYAGSWSEWCSDPARPVAKG